MGDPRFEQMLNAAGAEGWEVVKIEIPHHQDRLISDPHGVRGTPA